MAGKPNPIQVTAAIIQKDGKIFIAKRGKNKHLAGFWEFPGGKIEEGESDEACLLRELAEELGIKVKITHFFMENLHHYEEKSINLKAYFCEFEAGEITLHEHEEFAWVEKDELSDFNFAAADVPFVNKLNADQ